jgi:hypothetical protein
MIKTKETDVSQVVVIGTSAGGLNALAKLRSQVRGGLSGTHTRRTAHINIFIIVTDVAIAFFIASYLTTLKLLAYRR